MSILSISPQDNRLFSAEIASQLGDINAAVIVQQLHYWMGKEGVGTIISGVKYVYNSFNDWVKQFPWLSVWQFRKAMNRLRELGIVRVIRYKSRQWNQTNYYSLDSDRLLNFLKGKSAESIEKSDLCVSADREENSQQIEVRDFTVSYSKSTNQKKATDSKEKRSLNQDKIDRVAAARSKISQKKEKEPKEINTSQAKLNGLATENKAKLEPDHKVVRKENNFGDRSTNVIKNIKVVNPKWKSLTEELDGIGVPINKTLINLVKMYEEEEVKSAVALLKIRKREKHIPNPGGYFTAALKGNWTGSNLGSEEDSVEGAIDKGTVFRLWYDLAKELGYCTSQEMRDGEQWVNMGGNWEKWEDAVNRGYSLDYLKKVKRRN